MMRFAELVGYKFFLWAESRTFIIAVCFSLAPAFYSWLKYQKKKKSLCAALFVQHESVLMAEEVCVEFCDLLRPLSKSWMGCAKITVQLELFLMTY